MGSLQTPALPPSDLPSIVLVHPTREELYATRTLNGESWRHELSLPAYLRRETHLENQDLTKDGGITCWILIDGTAEPNRRPILASCESLRKRALVSREDGKVEESISHGIGSVFCNPEFRHRGYAQRMVEELATKLDTHQQAAGQRTCFTVLYSDIGKNFYSRRGWHAFPSSHIALPPVSDEQGGTFPCINTRPLNSQDLASLCGQDERILREKMSTPTPSESKIRVALIPDVHTMTWHHAREEFAAKELLNREPDIKGAYVKTDSGDQVWCIWTRMFGPDNTLHILRFMIEGETIAHSGEHEPLNLEHPDHARVRAATAVLQAAQLEAGKWPMKQVEIWNPTPLAVFAARQIDPTVRVIHREQESITSLRWHGDPGEHTKVEWLLNEKYGWC